MKTALKIGMVGCAVMAISACSQPEKKAPLDQSVETPAASPDANTSKSDATEFINKTAEGNIMEVLGGNLAAENAANPRIKAYGKMLAKDHTASDKKLQSIADQKNITLPDKLPADKQQHMDMMKDQKGDAFDRHYISMMIEDHKEDIEAFKAASKNIADPKLVEFAKNSLPVLQKHLDMAEAIQKSFKK